MITRSAVRIIWNNPQSCATKRGLQNQRLTCQVWRVPKLPGEMHPVFFAFEIHEGCPFCWNCPGLVTALIRLKVMRGIYLFFSFEIHIHERTPFCWNCLGLAPTVVALKVMTDVYCAKIAPDSSLWGSSHMCGAGHKENQTSGCGLNVLNLWDLIWIPWWSNQFSVWRPPSYI